MHADTPPHIALPFFELSAPSPIFFRDVKHHTMINSKRKWSSGRPDDHCVPYGVWGEELVCECSICNALRNAGCGIHPIITHVDHVKFLHSGYNTQDQSEQSFVRYIVQLRQLEIDSNHLTETLLARFKVPSCPRLPLSFEGLEYAALQMASKQFVNHARDVISTHICIAPLVDIILSYGITPDWRPVNIKLMEEHFTETLTLNVCDTTSIATIMEWARNGMWAFREKKTRPNITLYHFCGLDPCKTVEDYDIVKNDTLKTIVDQQPDPCWIHWENK